jgi:prephenate dehydratase
MPAPEISKDTEVLSSGVQDPFISNIEPAVARYLGPKHSYSEIISTVLFGTDSDKPTRRVLWRPPQYVPHANFSEVAEGVFHDRSNRLTVGVLPVENTKTSPVQPVVDALLTGNHYVLGEGSLIIRLVLAGEGTKVSDVDTVYSQSKPFGQAALYLASRPFRRVEVESTSKAAEIVSKQGPDVAALCSMRAARHYNLRILAQDVQDDRQNQTRFLIVQSIHGLHHPDLDMLNESGRLAASSRAKVAGIVSPRKPSMEDGFFKAMQYMGEMDVHAASMGRRNTQTEPVGGDSDYFVEFTGHPRTLWEVFRKSANYEAFMAFRLLGVYAVGNLYSE